MSCTHTCFNAASLPVRAATAAAAVAAAAAAAASLAVDTLRPIWTSYDQRSVHRRRNGSKTNFGEISPQPAPYQPPFCISLSADSFHAPLGSLLSVPDFLFSKIFRTDSWAQSPIDSCLDLWQTNTSGHAPSCMCVFRHLSHCTPADAVFSCLRCLFPVLGRVPPAAPCDL